MDFPRKLNAKGEDLPKVHHRFIETYPYVKKKIFGYRWRKFGGRSSTFLAEEGSNATIATFRKDWEETDPKQGCIKHWVKEPLEEQLAKSCLNLFPSNRWWKLRKKKLFWKAKTANLFICRMMLFLC